MKAEWFLKHAVRPLSMYLEADAPQLRNCVSQLSPITTYRRQKWKGWEIRVKDKRENAESHISPEGVPFYFSQSHYTAKDMETITPTLERYLEKWPFEFTQVNVIKRKPNIQDLLAVAQWKAIANCCVEEALPHAPLYLPSVRHEGSMSGVERRSRVTSYLKNLNPKTGQTGQLRKCVSIFPSLVTETSIPAVPERYLFTLSCNNGRPRANPVEDNAAERLDRHKLQGDAAIRILEHFHVKHQGLMMSDLTSGVLFRLHCLNYGVTLSTGKLRSHILLTHFENFLAVVKGHKDLFDASKRWTRAQFLDLIKELYEKSGQAPVSPDVIDILLAYCHGEQVFFGYEDEKIEALREGWLTI